MDHETWNRLVNLGYLQLQPSTTNPNTSTQTRRELNVLAEDVSGKGNAMTP